MRRLQIDLLIRRLIEMDIKGYIGGCALQDVFSLVEMQLIKSQNTLSSNSQSYSRS